MHVHLATHAGLLVETYVISVPLPIRDATNAMAGDVAEVSLLNIAVQVRLQSMYWEWKRSSCCYAGCGI